MRTEPLLEREEHLRRLDQAVETASTGEGDLVMVEGAAGIGKSSLLAHALERGKEKGCSALLATGDELERDLPFGIVTGLLSEPARSRSREEPGFFSGAAKLALPLLDGSMALPIDRAPGHRLLHGLYWLVADLAEHSPLVMVVDDAHWADAPSLRFLHYLARRIEALPAAILLGVRSGEPTATETKDALERLRALPISASITPNALGHRSVKALVEAELPNSDPALAPAFYEATGGNPFLLRELLVTAREGGATASGDVSALRPETVRDSILVRLRQIGAHADELASAVAVLGPSASHAAAARLAGIEEEAAACAADALAAAQMLRSGEPLSFEHPIVREVVYAAIPSAQRRRQHSRAASLLHESGAEPDEIASHLMLAEPFPDDWAVAVLREAGESAQLRGDPAAATRILRRAVEQSGEREDPGLVIELGRAEMLAHEPEGLQRLESAQEIARDPLSRIEAGAALAQGRMLSGDSPGTFAAIREALERTEPGTGGAAEAELFVWALFSGRLVPELVDETAELIQRPRLDANGVAGPAEVARRALLAFDLVFRGDLSAATDHLDWAVAHAGEHLEVVPRTVRSLIGACTWRLGRYAVAQRMLDRQVEETTQQGDLFELAGCLEGRIGLGWGRGSVNDCLADVEAMIGLDEEEWEPAASAWRAVAAEMLLERDDVDAARDYLVPAEDAEPRLAGTLGWLWLPYARGLLAARVGDWEEAHAQALSAGERLLEVQITSPDYFPWRSLAARAAGRLDDTEQAERLAGEELDLARAAGSRKATGIALASLGAIRSDEEGIELLQQAVEELDRTEAELAPARAKLELGMALRRARRPRDACRPLEEALDRARRVGSVYVAQQALGELRAAGRRPRRLALSGVESLTPGQSRVARMAAEGLSNREIAEALFVTRRTVETHLTHVYSKLDIDSREELPAALGADDASPAGSRIGSGRLGEARSPVKAT